MRFADLRSALIQSWVDGGFELDTAYPNRKFDPVAGTPWAAVFILPNQPEVATLGDSGADQHDGVFQISLFYPPNQGDHDIMAKADAIAAHYKAGKRFSYDGQSLLVRNCGRAQGRLDDGWYRIDLTINWVAWVDRILLCAYQLDATEAELQNTGFAGRLSMDATEQIGTYTVQSGLGNDETYAAAPADISSGSADLIDFSTGKKAIKYELAAPSPVSGILQSVFTLTPGFTERFQAELSSTGIIIQLDNTTVYSDSTPGTRTVCMIFDSATATATAIVDGSEVALSNNAYTPGSWQLTMNCREPAGLSGTDTGTTFTDKLLTDAAGMPEASGYGATTICGNTI